MRAILPSSITRDLRLKVNVLATQVDHMCVFWTGAGCSVHQTHGPAHKPGPCRRFPFGLVATPRGGRVTTEHRCPCRTLGPRPPLDLAEAEASLMGEGGRLEADLRAPESLPIEDGVFTDWEGYEAVESPLLDRLARGDDALEVLDRPTLPPLDGVRWLDVAHLFRAHLDGTRCGDALAWFGDLLLALSGEPGRWPRPRPWSPSFDRAEARSGPVAPAEELLSDWVADALWGLGWLEAGSLERGRSELAVRLGVARAMIQRLEGSGVRPDRAAAEALLVVELAGACSLWPGVLAALRTP